MSPAVGSRKKFRKEDYTKYNGIGVVLVSSLFECRGYCIKPFEEKAEKQDLFVTKNDTTYKVEAERRSPDAKEPMMTFVKKGVLYFQYPTLHALERKQGVDDWDFYSQVLDCYNFDTKEQTFAIATVHKNSLVDLSTSKIDCNQKDRPITKDEEMGLVPIEKALWTILEEDGSWPQVSVDFKKYFQVLSQFCQLGIDFAEII